MSNQLRDSAAVKTLTNKLARLERPIRIMEVCGTHTMSIGRWGLRKLLPPSLQLISGPGCPVCVTPVSYFDALWQLPDVTIAVFGDLLRVPGSHGTLENARARGMDVQVVHGPEQALKLARKRATVLAAVGFETTTPGIADTIRRAAEEKLDGFHVLCGCKLVEPALCALLDGKPDIDGFLLPGHVSAITGSNAFDFLPRDYAASGVVAGFEPVDILAALVLLARMICAGEPGVRNAYPRIVTPQGNQHAQKLIRDVFVPIDTEWRGLGIIPASGLGLAPRYAHLDAARHYGLSLDPVPEPPGCRCGDVLQGRMLPHECPLFAQGCTPSSPVGPCMVSSEGSCAAWYRYERA
ncbi:MAG: hydrogenase formation protein HypD [Candidatus Cloacimonetes bacterium]|nr:hydrogenase formation protein HypD [Candidatus Cloacimonadota bacterium]